MIAAALISATTRAVESLVNGVGTVRHFLPRTQHVKGKRMRRFISGLTAVTLAIGISLASGMASAESSDTIKELDLMAADRSGRPEGTSEDQWSEASGNAIVVSREDGQDVVEIRGGWLRAQRSLYGLVGHASHAGQGHGPSWWRSTRQRVQGR